MALLALQGAGHTHKDGQYQDNVRRGWTALLKTQDKDGNFISEYPDRNNHAIDAVRYGTNMIWRRRGQ